ncbi:MAG: dephospho-CoA kinase [Firmicutes bacterium]|nr:dephospho-CoA kinase [Bacillota bacterium]
MIVIGLTGLSGSGKGVVASILKKCGAFVFDCDEIAHSNMAKGGCAYADIVEYFGEDILNTEKEIDRKKLGDIVFSHKEKLKKLNALTHGRVYEYIQQKLPLLKEDIAVIDAPLLLDSGLYRICDKIWVVKADEDVRKKRIAERDGISQERIEKRFKNQKSFPFEKADFIIDNTSKTMEELEREIKEAASKYERDQIFI